MKNDKIGNFLLDLCILIVLLVTALEIFSTHQNLVHFSNSHHIRMLLTHKSIQENLLNISFKDSNEVFKVGIVIYVIFLLTYLIIPNILSHNANLRKYKFHIGTLIVKQILQGIAIYSILLGFDKYIITDLAFGALAIVIIPILTSILFCIEFTCEYNCWISNN